MSRGNGGNNRIDNYIDDTWLADRYLKCSCGFETFRANNPMVFRDQESNLAIHLSTDDHRWCHYV